MKIKCSGRMGNIDQNFCKKLPQIVFKKICKSNNWYLCEQTLYRNTIFKKCRKIAHFWIFKNFQKLYIFSFGASGARGGINQHRNTLGTNQSF